MEPDQCTWEKPMKKFLQDAFVFVVDKLNIIHKAALFGMVLMVVYNYYGREMRAAYRRFLVFREEFLVFSRAYRHELLDAGDSLASEDKEVKVAPPSSQYQNVAADDNQSEWDFGSSDDDYETDLDDERFSDLARAIAEHERRQAEVDRMREQIRITETIEFDEYLLAKGLIDESEFGKTLMVEI